MAYSELNMSYEDMKYFLNRYFFFLTKYIKENNIKDNITPNLSKYEKFFMEKYQPKNLEDEEEFDDFFDFDSEEVDSAIENMHLSDEKKISAEEFIEENGVDIGVIDDLKDYLEEYDNMVKPNDTLSEDDLEIAKKCIKSFANIINSIFEFRNLAYSLESLNLFLENFNTNEPLKLNMLKIFLDTVIDDLKKFEKEVFEDATANDIHYLDASLLANITQMEIALK